MLNLWIIADNAAILLKNKHFSTIFCCLENRTKKFRRNSIGDRIEAICCLEGFQIKFQLIYLRVFENISSFVNLLSRTNEARKISRRFRVLSPVFWIFYAHVMHNQIYFVIIPRNYVIGDSLKLYKIFCPLFFLTPPEKAATCFGIIVVGIWHATKKVPDESQGENFTIFIFHYALVFALTGVFRNVFLW